MSESKFIRLNVAFKPPENVVKKAIAMSQQIGRNYKADFALDGVNFHPHITIYQPEYPVSSFDEVVEMAGKVADKIAKTPFAFEKFDRHKSSLDITFKLTLQIKDIHELVVKKFNPLRKEHQRKKFQPGSAFYKNLSSAQKENCKKFGHPNIMKVYKPHLTLIRLTYQSSAKNLLPNLKWKIPKFIVKKIAVFKEGKHGICKELVKEFSLK